MPSNRKKSPPRSRIETSGVPRRIPDKSPELGRKVAERFGIVPPPERPKLPTPEHRFTEVKLGNQELPVFDYLDDIVQKVDDNPVVICVAETGSGKSTQIPQALLERGYKVTLTQPRRIAAEMLAHRISDEISSEEMLGKAAGRFVGFQTAELNTLTEDTRISVVTDGLRLVQELGILEENRDDAEPEVLIIDEVHERNTNIDVLIAWTQRLVAEGSNLRVVFTTASINADKLARHYDKIGGIHTPIVEIPGRSYDIKKIERPDSTLPEEVAKLAREGKNVLAFLPGLREIEDAIDATKRALGSDKNKVQYQRLHGKISPYEQQQVEMEIDGTRLVFATNVAETSITIPDVDAIVDSGLQRQVELTEDGIESLPVVPISKASCLQRAGRCGRTKEGLYVLTRLNRRMPYVSQLERSDYSVPEIKRSNQDKTVLSVACAGLDISGLDLLDPLDSGDVARSKRALRVLGAFDEQNTVTERGRRMNTFPVKPSLSRMLVYGIEQDFSPELRRYLAAMVATVENGGLPDYAGDGSKQWKRLTTEKQSDFLAQLDMFIGSQDLKLQEIREHDLNERAYTRTQQLYQKILHRSKIRPGETLRPPTEDQRQQIVEAITAGMIDFVYRKNGSEYMRTSHMLGKKAVDATMLRSIGDRSIVRRRGGPELVVANPYILVPREDQKHMAEKHIIQDITETTPAILAKVAVELCEWQDEDEKIIWRRGTPYQAQRKMFRSTIQTSEIREIPLEWSPDLAREIVSMLQKTPGRHLKQINSFKKESEKLAHRSSSITPIHANQITEMLEKASALRKKSINGKPMSPEMLDVAVGDFVDAFHALLPSEAEREKIMADSPDFIEFESLSLELGYRKGEPYIAKISDEIKQSLHQTTGKLKLPDGRDILVPHKIGRSNKRLTIDEFRGTTS